LKCGVLFAVPNLGFLIATIVYYTLIVFCFISICLCSTLAIALLYFVLARITFVRQAYPPHAISAITANFVLMFFIINPP